MAKTRPSVQKRQYEAAKMEKAQQKAARKAQRKAEKEERRDAAAEMDEDPDLAGIVAGPQPVEEEDWVPPGFDD